jgi:hypothetical protein
VATHSLNPLRQEKVDLAYSLLVILIPFRRRLAWPELLFRLHHRNLQKLRYTGLGQDG